MSIQAIRERVGDWLNLDMSRHDRRLWASCASLARIGQMTAYWLRGDLTQTPSHCGPPDPETRPYLEVLRVANFAGFVTTESQAGDWSASDIWEAYCCGFLDDEHLAEMEQVIGLAPPLVIRTKCRGREHYGHKGRWLACPRRDLDSFYSDCCPLAAAGVRAAWHVTIADPDPGRNDRLWPALAAFAGMAPDPDPAWSGWQVTT